MLTTNLASSVDFFRNSNSLDLSSFCISCDPSTSYQDKCFVSIFGEKILSSIKWSAKSLSDLFSSSSKFIEYPPIANPAPSVYSEITRVFQEYAKPCFEIRIGQSRTAQGYTAQFNLLDLSLKLGDKILRKDEVIYFGLYLFNELVLHETFFEGESTRPIY